MSKKDEEGPFVVVSRDEDGVERIETVRTDKDVALEDVSITVSELIDTLRAYEARGNGDAAVTVGFAGIVGTEYYMETDTVILILDGFAMNVDDGFDDDDHDPWDEEESYLEEWDEE